MSHKDLSGRMARWSLQLQGYDFEMIHRKGSLNIVPDTLSRFDVDEILGFDKLFEIDVNAPDFQNDEYEQLRDTLNINKDSLPDLCF